MRTSREIRLGRNDTHEPKHCRTLPLFDLFFIIRQQTYKKFLYLKFYSPQHRYQTDISFSWIVRCWREKTLNCNDIQSFSHSDLKAKQVLCRVNEINTRTSPFSLSRSKSSSEKNFHRSITNNYRPINRRRGPLCSAVFGTGIYR